MKKCFKCKEVKPLKDFYKHPQMADGHLNKCRECAKKDSDVNFKRKMLDPHWQIKERERQRKKEEKRRNLGIATISIRKKYDRPMANTVLGNAVRDGRIKRLPCEVCGNEKAEGHHEDYSKHLDVVWLCSRHHSDRHIHLRNAKTLGQEPMPINYFIKSLQVTA